jgi:transposase
MLEKQTFAQMLGITAPWKISAVETDHDQLTLTIRVEVEAGTTWIEDGVCRPIHGYEERQWKHLCAFQYQTTIVARVPRIRVPLERAQEGRDDDDEPDDQDDDSGSPNLKKSFRTQLVTVPWADARVGYSRLFECFAITLLQNAKNLLAAAKLLQISRDLAESILERAVARGMLRRPPDQVVQAIGVDEKKYASPYKFATLLCDLTEKRLLDLCDGRTAEQTIQLIQNTLTETQQGKVNVATLDMSAAYTKAIKHALPKAALVYDQFHIAQLFTKAMGEVRRGLQKEAREEGLDGKELKGLRYLLVQNAESMKPEERTRLETALIANERLSLAWEAKENFQLLWESQSVEEGRRFFLTWHTGVMQLPGLRAIKRAAKTINDHLEGVLHWLQTRLTNAFVEGLNSLIAAVKSSARGLRNFQNFRTRMLFYFGKLDLMPRT